MIAREEILSRTCAALGRQSGDPIPDPPPVMLHAGTSSLDQRVEVFKQALEALAGKVAVVKTVQEAREYVGRVLEGRQAVASCAPILSAAGIASLPGVSLHGSREALATAEAGITSADYALADTGSLVFFTESRESRMISLLPPCHIAVIDRTCILASLDDLFVARPLPGVQSSAMVVVTGPSRTADIEMRLVRGVHGPGEIHVIIVEDVTAIE